MKKPYYLKTILFISLNIIIQTLVAKEFAGVDFSSETPRTSISVFNESKKKLNDQFAISFDLSIDKSLSIGQVFTLDNKIVPLSLTYIGRDSAHYMFVLSCLSDKNKYITIPLNKFTCQKGKWNNIRLDFSSAKKSVTITIDGQLYELKDIPVPVSDEYNFIFGPNQMALSDAPPMAISNIRIFEKGKEIYHFPLNESSGNIATDVIQNAKAQIISPIWLINDHHYWKKNGEFTGSIAAGITYDSRRGRVVIISEDSVTFVGMRDNSWYSVRNEKKLPFRKISGEVHYNSESDSLYFYNLTDEQGVTHPFIASFSADGRMGNIKSIDFTNPLHHHAHFLDESTNTMYIFGGYGNFTYSNKMYSIGTHQDNWESFIPDGDKISPRMHTVAGKGRNKEEFFVFGGVGNVSGKQELGKEFYFDLYSFNTKTGKIKELWSSEYIDSILIPKRNLIYNKKEDKIYTICCNRTNGQIALYAIDPASSKITRMSDMAIVNTNSIYSSAYLFYDEVIEQFIMVVRQSDENNNSSDILLYTLNAPVLPDTMLHNNVPESENKTSLFVFISILSAIILLAGIWIRRKIRKPEHTPSIEKAPKEEPEEKAEAQRSENEYYAFPEAGTICKVNAIYLFGEICIYDKKGEEITSQFSSKIKQVLALFILNSGPGKNGLSSETLSLTLWSNKTVADSKNIRGVTINHLRKLLNDIDGISLIFEKNRWRISITAPLYCDYLELSGIRASEQLSDEQCESIVNIFKRGDLLPSFYQYDWYETRKVEYDEHLYNLLEKTLPQLFEKKQYREVIFLADKLFSIDNLNENALNYKVVALRKLGKQDIADLIFEKFRKEYMICYNTTYNNNPTID